MIFSTFNAAMQALYCLSYQTTMWYVHQIPSHAKLGGGVSGENHKNNVQ